MTTEQLTKRVRIEGQMWVGGMVHPIDSETTIESVADSEGEKVARKVLKRGAIELNDGRRCVRITLVK